ncbi:MAG: cytochrome c biogenesis protein CcsA [Sedimentisphaerales bacterium]|nr:cytochrome c biogenesis protein CcsA [Sedimentisphaerales bacterium]
MEVKYSIQGLLIYLTIAGYVLALAMRIFGKRKIAQAVFGFGFVVAVASLVYRRINVGHFPLQNMFELFLVMGAGVYLISLICRKLMRIDQVAADLLIGIIVLFPAGFIFDAAPKQLPPALQSVFFIPHVAAYLLAYILMFKAAIAAAGVFIVKERNRICFERDTYQLISAGFPLLTLGLILGSIWAQMAWADFWGFDPKEQWSLATWLIFAGYFHFRSMFKDKYPQANSIWAISGFSAIVITLLWVNLSRIFSGLHNYAV